MAKLTLKLSLKWIETEPDGGTCYLCKDVIYLKAIAPVVLADGKPCGGTLPDTVRFCQSCATTLELTTKD